MKTYLKLYEHHDWNRYDKGHKFVIHFNQCGKYRGDKKYKNKICPMDKVHNIPKKTKMEDEASSIKWNLLPGEYVTFYQDKGGKKGYFTVQGKGQIKNLERIKFDDCISSFKRYRGKPKGLKPRQTSFTRQLRNLIIDEIGGGLINGAVVIGKGIGEGIEHAYTEFKDEVGDFFASESEKDRGVIKRGTIGDGVWFLLTPEGNVRLDNSLGFGVSTKIFITCTTEDGKNKGHLYQNKLGIDVSLEQGGHVEEKNFTGSTEYDGKMMLIGTRESRFASRANTGWTFITAHIFNDVRPVVSVSSEGDVGVVLTAYGLTVNIPITDKHAEAPHVGAWKMSFKDASIPYSKFSYNKEGFVDGEGKVKNRGLGCSAFVSVVLHRMQNGEQWLESFDWRAHKKTGYELADAFGLSLMATIPSDILTSHIAREALVKSGRLKANALYLFDVWKGRKQGHCGFILVKPNGEFEQFHYSGLKDYQGLTYGNFQEWYEASQYKNEKIQLYGVSEP